MFVRLGRAIFRSAVRLLMNAQVRAFLEARKRIPKGGVRGRYAPSPSGPLHLGNARTALLAWLQTRLHGGCFVLRMEDLDVPRIRPGSARGILEDLAWMGIDWDEGPDKQGPCTPYDQSERNAVYGAALDILRHKGLLFPCFCSRKDLADAASAPHGAVRVYPGYCKRLTEREWLKREQHRVPALRFIVPAEEVVFEDVVCGPVRQDLIRQSGDFIVRRGDGLFAYQLAVVVDDGLMGMTHVVRGVDLLDCTPRQIAMFRVLDFELPQFWHVPLMLDDHGHRMAKRNGSDSIAQFRQDGGSPAELVGFLAASLGLVDKGVALSTRELLHGLNPDVLLQKLRAEHGTTTS